MSAPLFFRQEGGEMEISRSAEQVFLDYRLYDIVIGTDAWEAWEYRILLDSLERGDLTGEEAGRLSARLRGMALAAGWDFLPEGFRSSEEVLAAGKRALEALRRLEEGRRERIPVPLLEALERKGKALPAEAGDRRGDPGPKPLAVRIRGAVVWNLARQTGLPLSAWQIRSLEIREGVHLLDQNVFACCLNLRQVSLPDSLEMVSPGAFALCPCLDSVLASEETIDRLFPLRPFRLPGYRQIGHPAFEHLGMTGPRDLEDGQILLAAGPAANHSDSLKSPWYVRRLKGTVVYNSFQDPRYPEDPPALALLRRGLDRAAEIVLCPACLTPYERPLRAGVSDCPWCGRRIRADRKGDAAPLLRRFDPLPGREGTGTEAERIWAGCLRLLVGRATDPAWYREACLAAFAGGEEEALLDLVLERDSLGGTLPPDFPDPGVSVWMAWKEEKKKKPSVSRERIGKRERFYGVTGQAFEKIFVRETLPLSVLDPGGPLWVSRADWAFERKEEGGMALHLIVTYSRGKRPDRIGTRQRGKP